jgi:DNA sulfur modification protein DndB
MQVIFPAMRGRIGGRDYFATIMALSEIPRFFKFNDWELCTPELRAQRVLNEDRVPVIAKYILDNEDSYLFSSIAASYTAEIEFAPASADRPDVGYIQLNLEEMEFVINDGQHRCAAIAQALKENPALGKDRISVLLFPMEDLQRMQQMFSDLNRFAQRSSKSLNILYDHRDSLAALTMEVVEGVDVFRGLVDMERVSIPTRSEKLFTLTTIYDANKELLGTHIDPPGSDPFRKTVKRANDYWNTLAQTMVDWKKVAAGQVAAAAVRQEKLSTHAVVMRALGGVGRILLRHHPENWRDHLQKLATVDWRKSMGTKVNPMWDGVCITAGSVVSNRQARLATLEALCRAAEIAPANSPGAAKRKRGRPRKEAEKEVR